jgi:hypothetical protein
VFHKLGILITVNLYTLQQRKFGFRVSGKSRKDFGPLLWFEQIL